MELQGRALCPAFHPPIKDFLSNNEGDYLEIGTFYGHFLTSLASEYTSKKLYAIDPFIDDGYTTWITGKGKNESIIEIREIALSNIAQVNNVELFEMTTETFLTKPFVADVLKNVSCVLIDGSHHYDDIKHDLELVMQIKNTHNKVVVFDDVKMEDVIRSIDDFKLMVANRTTSIDHNPEYVAVYFK